MERNRDISPLFPRRRPFTGREIAGASAVLGLAAFVRVLYLVERASDSSVRFLHLDARFHDLWAQSILNGNLPGDTVFFRAPLYPYLLALFYSVAGHDTFLPLIAQAALGVAGVAAVMLIAFRLGGGSAAVVAGLAAGLHAPLVFFEGELLLDAPLTAGVAIWLAVLPGVLEGRGWGGAMIGGVLTGLLAILRPPMLPVGLFLCAVLLFRPGWDPAMARRFVVAGAGVALVVLPVTVRNALVGGELVVIAAQGGINFYIGNNPSADGGTSSVPEAGGIFWSPVQTRAFAAAEIGRVPGPGEESLFWAERGFRFIADQPVRWAELTLRKAALLVQRTEIPNNRDVAAAAGASGVLKALPGGFWMLAPAGITGLVLLARRKVGPNGRPVVWYAAAYALVTVAFFVCDRFRLPLVPPLAVGAGIAVGAAVQNLRGARWSALAGGLLGFGVLMAFAHLEPVQVIRREEPREFFRLAGMAMDREDDSAAAGWLNRVEEAGLVLPHVQGNLGVVAWRRGDTAGARRHFREELRRFPGAFAAEANLGVLETELGNADAAHERFARAARARPDRDEGYVGVAAVLLARGDAWGADSVLRSRPAAYGPPSPRMDFMRVQVVLRCGTPLAVADSVLEEILARMGRPVQPAYVPEDWEHAAISAQDDRKLEAEVWCKRGHIAAAQGNLERAGGMFRRATDADPANPEGWANGGLVLLYLGRAGESVKLLEAGARLHPHVPEVWQNYAVALVRAGRREEGEQAMTHARMLAAGDRP